MGQGPQGPQGIYLALCKTKKKSFLSQDLWFGPSRHNGFKKQNWILVIMSVMLRHTDSHTRWSMALLDVLMKKLHSSKTTESHDFAQAHVLQHLHM